MNERAWWGQRRQLHPPRGLKGHRSGPGVWTGAVQRWRASTGWREQVDPADSDGTDRCVWIMCVCSGCCQDRDQLNPPSERRQASPRPLHPSLIPSQWCPIRNGIVLLKRIDSFEPIRNCFGNDAEASSGVVSFKRFCCRKRAGIEVYSCLFIGKIVWKSKWYLACRWQ